jgi:hypothetical protein
MYDRSDDLPAAEAQPAPVRIFRSCCFAILGLMGAATVLVTALLRV